MGDRKVVCRVALGAITLKLTLTPKVLAKPLGAAVLTPFLGAYNKKTPDATVRVANLECIKIDGAVVAHNDDSISCGELLLNDSHDIVLFLLSSSMQTIDISDDGGAPACQPPPAEPPPQLPLPASTTPPGNAGNGGLLAAVAAVPRADARHPHADRSARGAKDPNVRTFMPLAPAAARGG